MKAKEELHGLACPNCGGMVPIPEGQTIVHCPFCDLRSLVRGERGLLRYQVALKIDRKKAEVSLREFLKGNRAIATRAAKDAQITESFLAYLPFWALWSRVLGWVFGEKKVGSGDDARFEPRELKVSEEMSWNGAAADMAEFGVESVQFGIHDLEPFDADDLHADGFVFEPMGSLSDARSSGENFFQERVDELANLDRISQVFVRFLKRRMGLVYFPLWVMRYRFRERTYQVVVDGTSGKVLYGKAPGNTIYRAAMLIGGMALGAFLAVDVSSLVIWFATQGDGDDIFTLLLVGLGLIGFGISVMTSAYRRFRHGEIFEYRVQRRRCRRSIFDLRGRIMDAFEVRI
jgi:hypothetical protein